MKRRWKILLGLVGTALVAAATPVVWIATACTSPVRGIAPQGYHGQLSGGDTRPEAQTWLTYPEWHIVYSTESIARHLAAGKRPSAYPYLSDIGGFWSSYCQVNRIARQAGGSDQYSVVIDTIGISYSAELLVKAAWENTVGRLFERLSGWTSTDDRHAAEVMTRYGAFMHETPWYRFSFGEALRDEWWTSETDQVARHWERRIALSLEYGVKAGYAKLIGWATGTAMGADEVRLRLLLRPGQANLAAIVPDAKVLGETAGAVKLDLPRYARFTQIVLALAQTDAEIVEIAGNDDVMLTLLVPDAARQRLSSGPLVIDMPLGDRPGWRRLGISAKAPALLQMLRAAQASGAEVEHVYDY